MTTEYSFSQPTDLQRQRVENAFGIKCSGFLDMEWIVQELKRDNRLLIGLSQILIIWQACGAHANAFGAYFKPDPEYGYVALVCLALDYHKSHIGAAHEAIEKNLRTALLSALHK